MIMYGTAIYYHFRLFINFTVCHLSSLALKRNRKQFYTLTLVRITSGPLALLTYKTDVL